MGGAMINRYFRLAAVSALALGLPAAAQAPVTLRLRFEPGVTQKYRSVFELDIPGAPKPKTGLPIIRSVNTIQATTDAVRRDGSGVLTLRIYPSRDEKGGAVPKSAVELQVRRTQLGETEVLKSSAPKERVGFAGNSAAQGSLLLRLPLRGVAVGETWTTTVPHPLSARQEAAARLTLARIEGTGPNRTAVLREEIVLPISLRRADTGLGAEVDAVGTVTLTGGVRLRLADGVLLSSRLEGGGRVSVGEGAGADFMLKMKMAMELQSSRRGTR